MANQQMRKLTEADWIAEGTKLFGPDRMKWKFVCPSCKHVASAEDYKAVGAPSGVVAFSCIGRYDGKHMEVPLFSKKGPCNYAGGGLFPLNPVIVTCADGHEEHLFEFAP